MKKKSTDNFPSQSPPYIIKNPPQYGGDAFMPTLNKEFRDLLLFNSIQDTHRPDDINICRKNETKNTIT